ncbi:MAG: type II secretion system protein GspL [Erysipelotrichaceae bacterium]|jgi:type IV pilus assembly protein PilM
MKKRMLGIDIGTATLRIAVCEDNVVLDYMEEDMEENMIQNGRVVSANAMGDFIKALLKQHHIRVKNTAIVLPAGSYYIRRTRMPKMTVSQLKVNLPYEFHDFIQQDAAQYVYDYQVLGMNETEMDLMAAAVNKDAVRSYEDVCKRAGLDFLKLVPDVTCLQAILLPSDPGEPLSVLPKKDHVLTREEKGQDYVVLDMGHSSARMHFYSNHAYEISRTLQTGAGNIVNMIAEADGVDSHIAWRRAESNAGDCLNQPDVADALGTFSTEIMRVVNFYNYNHPDNTLEVIYAMGDALPFRVVHDYVKDATGMEVKPLIDVLPDDVKAEGMDNGLLCYGAVIE